MPDFIASLERALGLREDAAPPAADADLLGKPKGKLGQDAQQQKNELDVKRQQEQQKDNVKQGQADNLYQRYQLAKREADQSEKDAAARQDVNLFNKAASARKRMEDAYQAWQLAQAQAAGQTMDPKKVGLPPDAVPRESRRRGGLNLSLLRSAPRHR